jgi:hypothetical protein
VKFIHLSFLATLALASAHTVSAQGGHMTLPHTVNAGSAFSIPTAGTGNAVLYIVGPGQALRREVHLGEATSFAQGVLYGAGHYVAILARGTTSEAGEFDVVPASEPATLGFLAKPSRLPVGLHNGISGALYVFDAYQNLITTPLPTSLELSDSSGGVKTRSVMTRNGLAWAEMDSAAKEGRAKFIARVGKVSSTRVIDQVPGDPCRLTITAHPANGKVYVETAPVRDCSGNAIPDGTIVTFSETLNSIQSTVDVPIKRGIATVEMPAYEGGKISVACGVVAGNEIRWGQGR